jgi:hypothetical protein
MQMRISSARRLNELQQSGKESFTIDEVADLFGIQHSSSATYLRRLEQKGVMRQTKSGHNGRWAWNSEWGSSNNGSPEEGTFPEAALSAIPRAIPIGDLRKILGVEKANEILQTLAAAYYKPIFIQQDAVDLAVTVVADNAAPGRLSHSLVSVFRRFMQDDRVARERFIRWAKGDTWQA